MAEEWGVVSVDDHLIEPPDTWTSRVPARYLDRCPKVIERDVPPVETSVGFGPAGQGFAWEFDGRVMPFSGLACSVGHDPEEWRRSIPTFADLYPGCHDVEVRLRDMDEAGVLASLNFPTMPGFGGTYLNNNQDRDLSLVCIRAFNDFVFDEWCAAAPGRFIPGIIVPYWDPALAVAEIERNAARGARAIIFTERPHVQGFPSLYDPARYWDPVFAAAEHHELVLCCHIGSSSQIDSPPEADYMTHMAETWLNAPYSLTEYALSGTFERFPGLGVVYSEASIGWMPFVFQTLDRYWNQRAPYSGTEVRRPPSEYFGRNIFGCFIEDHVGADQIEQLGVEAIMVEVDYPHADTIWPDVRKVIDEQLGHLDAADQRRVRRGNAERVFRFQPSPLGTR